MWKLLSTQLPFIMTCWWVALLVIYRPVKVSVYIWYILSYILLAYDNAEARVMWLQCIFHIINIPMQKGLQSVKEGNIFIKSQAWPQSGKEYISLHVAPPVCQHVLTLFHSEIHVNTEIMHFWSHVKWHK